MFAANNLFIGFIAFIIVKHWADSTPGDSFLKQLNKEFFTIKKCHKSSLILVLRDETFQ